MSRVSYVLCCALFAVACSQGADPVQSIPSVEGKADTLADNVKILDVQEYLYKPVFRDMLCTELANGLRWPTSADREGFLSDCPSFDMTVTEKAESRRYNHQSTGEPITFRMKVTISNGADTWQGELKRQLSSTFKLEWMASVEIPKNTNDEFIKEMADDIGEYFHYEDTEWASYLKVIGLDDLPKELMPIFEQRLADLNDDYPQEYPYNASFADDQYEIVKDGEVIGYVIAIWYDIDHPLFDGGGEHQYYNKDGVLLHTEEWWG